MGCDIHICCEARNFDLAPKPDKWYNVDHYMVNYEEGGSEFEVQPIYVNRNYTLFGTLAGVRGDVPEVISDPRGLPDDIDEYTERLADEWKTDGHSYSFLTYNEIVSWQKRCKHIYLTDELSEEQCEALGILGLTVEDWNDLIKKNEIEHESWNDALESLKPLVDAMQNRMKEVFDPYQSYRFMNGSQIIYDKFGDDFRIVFWFDS